MVSCNRKKSIAIVGTGISGSISALKSLQKNLDVTIFEKSKNFGGILCDAVDKNEIYFNACQYLNPEEEWFKLLDKKNFELNRFYHDKATYSDLFDEDVYENDIAGPLIKKKLDIGLLISLKKSKKNLSQRLSTYPKIIKNNLLEWLDFIKVDPVQISWNAATGLAINRFFFRSNIKELKIEKEKNPLFDNLVGLSRNEMGLKEIDASLPAKGFNHFFENLKKKLLTNNVNVNLNTIVKPTWEKNNLFLTVNNKKLSFDKIIWTGNPTGLIKNYGLPLLDSTHINSKHFYFEFEGQIKNNLYIQVYSKKTAINRIFIYNLNGKNKITVETLSTELNINDVIKFCNQVFEKSKLSIKINESGNVYSDLHKKYILFSLKDEEIIKDFIKSSKKSNLIHGNWLEYGRDQKINHLIKEIENI